MTVRNRFRALPRSAPPAIGLLAATFAGTALAGPLTGSGNHILLPGTIQVPPTGQSASLSNIVHPTSFDGTWVSPALPGWIGTFSASGPVTSNVNLGTTSYDFTTLAAGHLPAGTFFNFGDVDGGSGSNENLILDAYAPGGAHITSAWLDEPGWAWGFGRNSGNPDQLDMPGWSFSGGQYIIDGSTVTGFNPTMSFAMLSNTAIESLVIQKADTNYAFGLSAPVPTPASAALVLSAGLTALRRRR